MDRFARIVGTDNPQAAVGMLMRAALDGTKGNVQLLRAAMSVLRPEERNQLAALVLREMGKPVGSAAGTTAEIGFSVESFRTRLKNMNPDAKALMFGGEHADALNDLFRVVHRLADVEALANRSRSGTNFLNVSGVLGLIGLVTSGKIVLATGLAGSGMAMSLLLSRPSYVRWVTEYARLRAAVLRAPAQEAPPKITAALNNHVALLEKMARADQTLIPVANAVAEENGVGESGEKKQAPKQ